MRQFQALLKGGPLPVRRLGRYLFWGDPKLYRWLGIVRGHGDCMKDGFDFWMGGYPRSANTFALASFKLANPDVHVASHFHIPTFIIHGVQTRKPGLFLIRHPIDSVVSWTIFWEGRVKLEHSLDYYLDFHRPLLAFRKNLFVARFEDAIADFTGVLRKLNARFGTKYSALPKESGSTRRCLKYVEDCMRGADGTVNEFMVARPSPRRAALKPALVEELKSSRRLARKMESANKLYTLFCHVGRRNGASTSANAIHATPFHA